MLVLLLFLPSKSNIKHARRREQYAFKTEGFNKLAARAVCAF